MRDVIGGGRWAVVAEPPAGLRWVWLAVALRMLAVPHLVRLG
jgi:hypothetical protein